ncbi:MAG: acyl-CoA dehydrogenase [Frankiales bacterium]|nr:acyl-CoA dehydrogenase [Frankiales bacterium]
MSGPTAAQSTRDETRGHADPGLLELPEAYVALREEARGLAHSVRDIAADADEADAIDPETRRRLAASGLASVVVPASHGGRSARVDSLAVTVVREALAAESAHLDSMFAMQGIGSYAIAHGGTAEIQDRWLPAVAALDAIAALALTEPHVGSDLKSITTRIDRDGDELVVTGHKSFITNAGDADFYCVLGKEDDGFSLVLVPADSPGLSTTRPHQVIAPHVLGDVVLNAVRVPADHRLGEPGKGFRLVLATLATFRVSVAGAAVGLADAALDEAVRHTAGRSQFGVPLARLGGIPAALAASWTDIEMARSLTYRAAAAAARDPLGNLYLSSLAKVGATEAAGRVVDRAVQVMGRFGLIRGSKIERLYREARPMRIYEGATEVIWDSLAKQLVKERTR